jgi:DNA polymerase-3 subunit beta
MTKNRKKEKVESSPTPSAGSGQAQEGQTQTLEINVTGLREALELVGPAVPRKYTLPVVKNVRLGEGQVVATDLDVAVAAALPEAANQVLLPHQEVLEFLRYAPGHLTARITAVPTGEGMGLVSIAVDGMEGQFKAPGPKDFPPVPFTGPDQAEHQGVLDGDALVRAVATVLPSAATEETRPVLTGVCLTLGDEVEAAAADGFRLAWEKIPGRLP